jgi:hypothetical protein
MERTTRRSSHESFSLKLLMVPALHQSEPTVLEARCRREGKLHFRVGDRLSFRITLE